MTIKRFKKKHKIAISIIQITVFSWLCLMVLWAAQSFQVNAKEAQTFSSIADTQGKQLAKVTDQKEQMQQELEAITAKYPNPSKQEIEEYIKTIFGKDAPTALGISRHECGTWSPQYPACVHKSDLEDSVGIFQINLHNKYQNIHAARIPGTTMAQKEEWLKNPFQNTLYAFWIYKTSGFTPWTTFTSGAYLH